MNHPTSLILHAHWDALRGHALRAGRPLPGRDEIDPAAVRGVLASVFLLDVGPSGEAGFRLSGTRIDALFGRPMRGEAFGRVWAARSAASAASALRAALEGGRPVAAAARGGPPNRGAVDLELLLLPLDGGRHALGSLAPYATPGWMGLAAAAPLDLSPPGFRPAPRGGTLAGTSAGTFGRRRPAAVTTAVPAGFGPRGSGDCGEMSPRAPRP